jgi:hypothetical protein
MHFVFGILLGGFLKFKTELTNFFLYGTADPVVSARQMAPLREKAGALGMASRLGEGFSHPGIDDPAMTLRRLALVRDFLRGLEP